MAPSINKNKPNKSKDASTSNSGVGRNSAAAQKEKLKRLNGLRKRMNAVQREKDEAEAAGMVTSDITERLQKIMDQVREVEAEAPEAESSGTTERAGLSGADTTGAGTTGPNTTGPDTTVPDTTVPDTIVPDTTVPDTIVPDTTGPDTTGPDTTGAGTTRSGEGGSRAGGRCNPPNVPELANCSIGQVNVKSPTELKGIPIRSLKRGWGTFLIVLMRSGEDIWFLMAKPNDYPEVDVKSLPTIESDREKRKGLKLRKIDIPIWDGVENGDLKGMDPDKRRKHDRYPFTLTTALWEKDIVSWEARGTLKAWEKGIENTTKDIDKVIFQLAQVAVERAKRAMGSVER